MRHDLIWRLDLAQRLGCCAHCHQDLDVCEAQIAERRQGIDQPVKRLWVREHQVEEKPCPVCLHLTRASFPANVLAPAQDGTGIQTVATYLVASQAVPYARASQLLHDLFGVQLSPASITRFVQDCHEHLAAWEHNSRQFSSRRGSSIRMKPGCVWARRVGGCMCVGKEGWWVHVCATEQLTHYGAHPKRGREDMDAIGIVPLFEGILVHDALPSYQGYRFTEALCNVHHLRDLTFIEEELKQEWAKEMKDVLLSMKETVEQARVRGQPELETAVLAVCLPATTRFFGSGTRSIL